MDKLILTESQEAILFANWLRQKRFLFTKIAQETRTSSRSQKRKNKMEWLNPWFPDYFIIVWEQACFVELKRKKGWTVSEAQKVWIEKLNKSGIPWCVCKGAKEAIEFILSLMEIEKQKKHL